MPAPRSDGALGQDGTNKFFPVFLKTKDLTAGQRRDVPFGTPLSCGFTLAFARGICIRAVKDQGPVLYAKRGCTGPIHW